MEKNISSDPVDCACVIHGSAYDWIYVDRLYSMLCRNLSRTVRLHVYTEANRTVPAPYIKHCLVDWGISGPKKAWWYKMQMFDKTQHSGPLLYFDLDVVIVNNIDWIVNLPLKSFWAVRDFKYLWRPSSHTINSSVMYWNTENFDYVWKTFQQNSVQKTMSKFHGDQDFVSSVVVDQQRRYFDQDAVKSWRWQCLDGGYDFRRKSWRNAGAGTSYDYKTSIMVFHGHPKPHEITDTAVVKHWC